MLDEIRAFVVLAESGSLQRAAERLFRSIEASIVFMQGGHLGRLETAATFLQREFRDHFAEREGP